MIVFGYGILPSMDGSQYGWLPVRMAPSTDGCFMFWNLLCALCLSNVNLDTEAFKNLDDCCWFAVILYIVLQNSLEVYWGLVACLPLQEPQRIHRGNSVCRSLHGSVPLCTTVPSFRLLLELRQEWTWGMGYTSNCDTSVLLWQSTQSCIDPSFFITRTTCSLWDIYYSHLQHSMLGNL